MASFHCPQAGRERTLTPATSPKEKHTHQILMSQVEMHYGVEPSKLPLSKAHVLSFAVFDKKRANSKKHAFNYKGFENINTDLQQQTPKHVSPPVKINDKNADSNHQGKQL